MKKYKLEIKSNINLESRKKHWWYVIKDSKNGKIIVSSEQFVSKRNLEDTALQLANCLNTGKSKCEVVYDEV